MAKRIEHSRKFILVSADREISSGYLELLFSWDYCGHGCGSFCSGIADHPRASFWYDRSACEFIIRVNVNTSVSRGVGDYDFDEPYDLALKLMNYGKNHSLCMILDSSNVVDIIVPGRCDRAEGYHLIRIPCIERSVDVARAGFDSDVARWMIESADMKRRDMAAKERRKKRGIEKRKATMEIKREERKSIIENRRKKDALDNDRKTMIESGMTIGVLSKGLESIGDKLESIWGSIPEYANRRSLVMCDGFDFSRIAKAHHVMPFGKNKGIAFESIADNYCGWLLGCMVDNIMNKGTAPVDVYYLLVDYFSKEMK